MKRLPIGISDFKKLIENDYIFADTTGLIGDVYREAADIILLIRPRRFGIKAEFSCKVFMKLNSRTNFSNWVCQID